MSFILDALKKSEHERQRQASPGLVEPGIVRPRARLPIWAIVVGVLLGINLVALLLVLTHSWMAAPPAGSSVAARSAEPNTAPTDQNPRALEKPFSPLDAPPVYAPEIPVTAADRANPPSEPIHPTEAPNGNALRSVRRRDPSLISPPPPASDRRSAGGPVLNDDDYKASDAEVLPSINEINLTGTQALPELHLDVHVFATKAAERFVFINMRKYHEGATLQEGPTIERIRRDGVILNYNGLRFLLPRQ